MMKIPTSFRNLRERGLKLFRPKIIVPAAILTLLVGMPFAARAQFGLDPCCAIISAGLQSISSLLTSHVSTPLGGIQQTEQQTSSFEQQVIYPPSAIASAKGLITQLTSQLRGTGLLYKLPTASATLPGPQQLEQAILSHNPQAFGSITQSYGSLYGAVMPAANAPQNVRNLVDMNDAEAQAALKKAVQLDALADVEINVADQINQQLQTVTPGTAPILEAQAAAWLVRSNAYTQSALAELVRVRSIGLAGSGAQLKFSTSNTNDLQNSIGHILGQGQE